ncbi:unnamed protein product [Cochlearia groenlandica]
MDQFSGGNWSMIPNVQAQGNFGTPSNQDHHLFLQQQQQQQQQQEMQYQQFQQQQQFIQQQQFHQQRMLQSPPPQQSVHTPQQHQSLASHFHLYPLVEKLTDLIETGTRDHHSDSLVTELNSHFDKCQQLLNSISGSLGSKTMTVDGQKRNVEESEHLLQQRRDLIVGYRKSIQERVTSEDP